MTGYCATFSWPWIEPSETEPRAEELFTSLKENRAEFPFEEPHEVGLLLSPSGRWLVAVLVLTDEPGDDSVRVLGGLERWVRQWSDHQSFESVSVRGSSLQSCLPQFEIAHSFS